MDLPWILATENLFKIKVMLDKIEYRGETVALKIRSFKWGSRPLTSPREAIQVLSIKRQASEEVPAHYHKPLRRVTNSLQECLVVRYGKIKVDFYSPGNYKKFKHIFLKEGDVLIILKGGHRLHYLAESEIVEIKNGPYVDDKELIK